MRWLGLFLFSTLVVLLGFLSIQTKGDFSKIVMASPCDTPISWRLGSIDARFGLSEDQAKAHIVNAANTWGKEIKKPLFKNDSRARLTISFVYDRRQELDSQIRKLEDQLGGENKELAMRLEQHKKDVESFRQKVNALNEEISSWNSRGGAPQDVYNKLIEQQNELKGEADRLNAAAKELNLTAGDYNARVDVLNKNVSDFNQAISQKPEEGLYDPNKETISIYFVNDPSELEHTLAHEFGHALGMNHVENPDAIMFAKTNTVTRASDDDIAELQKACQEDLVLNLWAKDVAAWIRAKML